MLVSNIIILRIVLLIYVLLVRLVRHLLPDIFCVKVRLYFVTRQTSQVTNSLFAVSQEFPVLAAVSPSVFSSSFVLFIIYRGGSRNF